MKRYLAAVLAGIFAGVLLLVAAPPQTHAASAGSVSSCSYDNMGWVICPVLRATAQAADYGFTFISQNFLKIEVTFYNTQSGAAQAGAIIRTLANALFVVAFLIIVYSLITGRGVGNYNIKRLVPRFILAVIFVNASFFICQAIVDLSNVLGVTIQGILVNGVAKNIGPSAMPLASQLGKFDSAPLAEIVSGVVSKPDVAWVLLAPMAAVVMSSAIICAILIVVLIVRKALIVALILLAPLAFFAYLLPNTSDYFSKWMRLFLHTLLLFPIIAVLIGTGQIVSASIVRAGGADYKVENDEIYIKSARSPNASSTLYLVAAGAAVLPLAGTWYAFKAAVSGIDAAGARISQNGIRRSSRERDEKAKKREQTTMDLNKKSMMLRGINRLQQLNVAKDGESNASIFGRMGGAYRGRNKHQTKTPEQAKFDSQVQQRLNELRGGAEAGRSPQELYSQALQRYQDKVQDAGSNGVNINSYEGIDLKASEAYLLESLAQGGAAGGVGVIAAASGKEAQAGDKIKEEGAQSHYDKPGSSGGGSSGGGGSTTGAQQPAAGGVGQTPATAGQTLAASNTTVIVQQMQAGDAVAGTSGSSPNTAANGTGFMARRPSQSSNELLAKARAAKYVAGAQDALGVEDELLGTTPPVDSNDHDAAPKG